MFKNLKFQITVGLLVMLLAFVIPVQLRSMQRNEALESSQFERVDVLQQKLLSEQEKLAKANEQLKQYEDDLEELRTAAAENSGYSEALLQQLKRAQLLAGLTDVEGPGVTVTLTDSSMEASGLNTESAYILHDEDILLVLNELFAAGAEAVSINGERILATSEIRCAGPTVSINNTRYGTPFVIQAIGDSDTMISALNLRGGIKELLQTFGIQVTIQKESHVLVPRYKGAITFQYAQTVEEDGGEAQ